MFDSQPGTAALEGGALEPREGVPEPFGDRLSDAEWAELFAERPDVAEPGLDDPREPPGYSMADVEPSGWLALELDSGTADPAVMSDAHLVDAIVGFDRITSWAAARQARLLAEFTRRRPTDAVPHADRASVASPYAPDEIGIALTLARGTAAARLNTAERLLDVLPATHALWETGRIDTSKARAIHDATVVLSPELAAAVEARVLPRAPGQSLAQLRAALARAVIAADPAGAADRHHKARQDRRVCVGQEADGMASLWALLAAPDAAGAYEWLTRLARGLGPDDPRTMNERRADLLAALLQGQLITEGDLTQATKADSDVEGDGSDGDGSDGDAGVDRTGGAQHSGTKHYGALRPVTPGKPLIQVVVAYSTLIGADDQPAELIGHGPITAEAARQIATDSVWHRLLTEPASGALLDHGRTTYHPPAALADHVRARDQHCRFPLCRRTAANAELDHIHAWADGGTTSEANLAAYCQHHHRLKHHTGWRIAAHPDGRLTWTTPTGHRYTTEPHDYRAVPSPPAAAPEPPRADPDLDEPPF